MLEDCYCGDESDNITLAESGGAWMYSRKLNKLHKSRANIPKEVKEHGGWTQLWRKRASSFKQGETESERLELLMKLEKKGV